MFENVDMISAYKELGTVGTLLCVLAYFVYKDFVLNRTLQDALNQFTVALNVLIQRLGD